MQSLYFSIHFFFQIYFLCKLLQYSSHNKNLIVFNSLTSVFFNVNHILYLTCFKLYVDLVCNKTAFIFIFHVSVHPKNEIDFVD